MSDVLINDAIYYITSFLDVESRCRLSITCREYYKKYKVKINLCEVYTISPPKIVVKKLLNLDIPRNRIIISSGRRVLVWLTPDEIDYLFSQGVALIPAQTGAP